MSTRDEKTQTAVDLGVTISLANYYCLGEPPPRFINPRLTLCGIDMGSQETGHEYKEKKNTNSMGMCHRVDFGGRMTPITMLCG